MPGRIVGALNQGIASLGEKIGNNKHPLLSTLLTSHLSLNINQLLRVNNISAVLVLREINFYDVFSVQEKPYSIVD